MNSAEAGAALSPYFKTIYANEKMFLHEFAQEHLHESGIRALFFQSNQLVVHLDSWRLVEICVPLDRLDDWLIDISQ